MCGVGRATSPRCIACSCCRARLCRVARWLMFASALPSAAVACWHLMLLYHRYWPGDLTPADLMQWQLGSSAPPAVWPLLPSTAPNPR